MQFKIQIVTVDGSGDEVVHDIARIERDGLQPETLGLNLTEGKAILSALQTVIVEQQVADHGEVVRFCPACGTARTSKGQHHLQFRTVFGTKHYEVRVSTRAAVSHMHSKPIVHSQRCCPNEQVPSLPSSQPNGHHWPRMV